MATSSLLGWLSLLLAIDLVATAPTSSNTITRWQSIFTEKITKAPSGFSIRQVRIPNSTPRLVNATDLYVNALHKYKRPVPDSVYRRDASESSGIKDRQTFKLAPYFTDDTYTVPIQLGTPAQTYYVIFDTGSADLWVFSNGMPASESSGHVIYNPAASSTSQLAAGQNFSLDYGSGSASGDVYTDFLGVGPISISGYPMETALQVSSDFFLDAYNISGIWGTDMSYYQSQTPLAQPTWLTFAEYEIGITLFTISYVYYGAGTITFGTIDSTQYTGSISYTPVIANSQNNFWAVNLTGYSVGTGTVQISALGVGILDTGTTATYLPAAVVSAYWSQVSSTEYSDGNYYFLCNAALPDLHLTLQGGVTVTLHGAYINLEGPQSYPSGTYCLGGLQPNTDLGSSIIGFSIFQSMFLVMDLGNSRVGFATKTLLD